MPFKLAYLRTHYLSIWSIWKIQMVDSKPKLELHESIKKIDKEAHPNEQKSKELITLQGLTTSQINQALKADNPYPARVFLKVEGQGEDTPVFFRIRENNNWKRPKIRTFSRIEVKGYFEKPKNGSDRPSFTATSFTLLACPWSQSKPYHCPIDCQCLKGKELRDKVIREHNQKRFSYFQKQVQEFGEEITTKQKELEIVKFKEFSNKSSDKS